MRPSSFERSASETYAASPVSAQNRAPGIRPLAWLGLAWSAQLGLADGSRLGPDQRRSARLGQGSHARRQIFTRRERDCDHSRGGALLVVAPAQGQHLLATAFVTRARPLGCRRSRSRLAGPWSVLDRRGGGVVS